MAASLIPWQGLLDRHRDLFAHLDDAASLGIAGLGDETMVVCRRVEGAGWRASTQPFRGVDKAGVDLLIVLDQPAARKLEDGGHEDLLPVLRREIRLGQAICFCPSSHQTLAARGFQEIMEQFGMATMARSH